jgi:hypothetical protein
MGRYVMRRIMQPVVSASLLLVLACVAPGPGGRAADPDKAEEVAKKRQALWQALGKALPEKYKTIDVYAEDPSLTEVLFRSQGVTLRFSLRTGKVREVPHMKAVSKVNCITFEGGAFVLWYNGQRELTIY